MRLRIRSQVAASVMALLLVGAVSGCATKKPEDGMAARIEAASSRAEAAANKAEAAARAAADAAQRAEAAANKAEALFTKSVRK